MATMKSTPPRRPRQPRSTTRTSYHVGRPWMLDGKMLRAETGTPMRRIARAKRPFADAEPEPLTLANLTTKSLTEAIGFMSVPKGRADELAAPPFRGASGASVGVLHR